MTYSDRKTIIDILRNSEYEWRTIKGLAKEANLSEQDVYDHLMKLIEEKKVRRSFLPDIGGNDLYGWVDRVDLTIKRKMMK